MHGKVSLIKHDGRGIFKSVPQNFKSTRYHSLSASATTLPDTLAITAATAESGVIMAVRHRECTLEAVQYHPESILSEQGDEILKNFLRLKGGSGSIIQSVGFLMELCRNLISKLYLSLMGTTPHQRKWRRRRNWPGKCLVYWRRSTLSVSQTSHSQNPHQEQHQQT